MQGPDGRPPNYRQVGRVSELCHLRVIPHPPSLCCSYSLHDTWGAPEVVCPIVLHNIPDAHSPITATCGNVLLVRGLVYPKSPTHVPYSWPTHPAGVLPVASSVEVESKAMVATGAVCTAFHKRVTLPSRQAH